MKKGRFFFVGTILVMFSVASAAADVNELLTFTNYTDEELYIELCVYDDTGLFIYDLYVLENGSSIADFWAVNPFAAYSACAYGEISGDFYGCLDGHIGDYYTALYFDLSGYPYKSDPSDLPVEWFVFDNPNSPPDTLVIESDGYTSVGVGCFVGALSQ